VQLMSSTPKSRDFRIEDFRVIGEGCFETCKLTAGRVFVVYCLVGVSKRQICRRLAIFITNFSIETEQLLELDGME
jgi:hypothetical protein